MKGKVSGKH